MYIVLNKSTLDTHDNITTQFVGLWVSFGFLFSSYLLLYHFCIYFAYFFKKNHTKRKNIIKQIATDTPFDL